MEMIRSFFTYRTAGLKIDHALFKLNSQQEKKVSYGFAVNCVMFPVRTKDTGPSETR
jgi:hypothetical protein